MSFTSKCRGARARTEAIFAFANNPLRPEVELRYQKIDFRPNWGSFDDEVPKWARLIVQQDGKHYVVLVCVGRRWLVVTCESHSTYSHRKLKGSHA